MAAIRFTVNGTAVEVTDLHPTTTLLQYLRVHRRLTGTKEGCAEGDCGACTVVVGEWLDGRLRWRAVNACIDTCLADGIEVKSAELTDGLLSIDLVRRQPERAVRRIEIGRQG